MIKIIKGNILDAKEDVICHSVNCQGVMGSGLAKQIKNKYPNVYNEYKWVLNTFGSQLGHCQLVYCENGKSVANLFGQDRYGTEKRYTDYNYIKQAFEELSQMAKLYELSIAIPYNIGCGLGGGDWDVVYEIIKKVFQGFAFDVTIYKL